MLTNQDFQQITEIITIALKGTEATLREEIKGTEATLREEMHSELDPIKKELHSHTKQLKTIKKQINMIARVLDSEDVRLFKKIKSIEEHLGLQSISGI